MPIGKTIKNATNGLVRSNLYPLTMNDSAYNFGDRIRARTRRLTIGRGAFGKINSESLNNGAGVVATKYFLDSGNFCDNVNEVAILKYLKGKPNVAQYIALSGNAASSKGGITSLKFPAVLMATAKTSLANKTLYTSWAEIYAAIKGVLHGYNVLHKNGIVHRDTKPDNMLMTWSDEVWITDFGKARYAGASAPLDNYTGSLPWASPEIIMKALLGSSFSHSVASWKASDAWAVGCSIVDLLTVPELQRNQYKHLFWDNFDADFEEKGYYSIEKIVSVKGIPVASNDGEIYTLYSRLVENNKIITPTPEAEGAVVADAVGAKAGARAGAVKRYILDNLNKAIDVKHIDFERVCAVVEGLLTYNPEKRLTIADALSKLGESAEEVNVPTIYTVYMYKEGLNATARDDVNKIINEYFEWMRDECLTTYAHLGDARYTVLDRTFTYFLSYIKRYSMSVSDRDALARVLMACFFVAGALFDRRSLINIRDLPAEYNHGIIMSIITDIMKAQPLLGKTLLDEMCTVSQNVQSLGFLNMVCFQKMLYTKYAGRLEELKRCLITLTAVDMSFTDKATMDAAVEKYEGLINAAMSSDRSSSGGSRRRRLTRRARL